MFQRKCCTKYGFTCREEEGQDRGFRNSHVLTAEKICFLMEGGELRFTLTDTPDKTRGISAEAAPYSYTRENVLSIP